MDLDGNYNGENAFDFYDTTTNNPSLGKNDTHSHGTHIAGIIGAVGNNAIGITGINWDISLVQLRSLYATNSTVAIINAVNYASDLWETSKRIHILSFSIGMGGHSSQLENVIRSYCNKGGLFICSTGNDPQNNDLEGQHHYPSFYGSSLYSNPIANMITVGRTDIDDNRPTGANWGMNTIDIYAPGENIISTVPTDLCSDNIFECTLSGHKEYGYHYKSGSSMSTPHVSGVAALLLSMNPNLTAIQIKNCILNGADIINITTGDGNTQSVKRLNAWGAFEHMLENYIPSYTLGTTNTQGTLFTDRTSTYYLEKHPLAKIVLPYSEEFTFTISGVGSSVDVVLYDSEMNEIAIEKSWTNSLWTVSFTKELTSGVYYISPSYNATTGGTYLNLTVSHTHSYDFWENYSASKHIECCACGSVGTTKDFHVIRSAVTAGNKANCMYCGAFINLDDTIVQVPGLLNIQKVTINGSYILPNGIIVLVDEDIEAYENGTLVFYDQDKLPQTQ